MDKKFKKLFIEPLIKMIKSDIVIIGGMKNVVKYISLLTTGISQFTELYNKIFNDIYYERRNLDDIFIEVEEICLGYYN